MNLTNPYLDLSDFCVLVARPPRRSRKLSDRLAKEAPAALSQSVKISQRLFGSSPPTSVCR
jgi:hypothetical protein